MSGPGRRWISVLLSMPARGKGLFACTRKEPHASVWSPVSSRGAWLVLLDVQSG